MQAFSANSACLPALVDGHNAFISEPSLPGPFKSESSKLDLRYGRDRAEKLLFSWDIFYDYLTVRRGRAVWVLYWRRRRDAQTAVRSFSPAKCHVGKLGKMPHISTFRSTHPSGLPGVETKEGSESER